MNITDSKWGDLAVVAVIAMMTSLVVTNQRIASKEEAPIEAPNAKTDEKQIESILSVQQEAFSAQREALNKLSERIDLLEAADRLQESRFSSGRFWPTSEGFQRIDSGLGTFAVSIEGLKSYGDGTRLVINVGNPSAASFQGVKLTVNYEAKFPSDLTEANIEKHRASKRVKEQEILKPVKAGSWNPTPVILPGVKPDELGLMEIRIESRQISLSEK